MRQIFLIFLVSCLVSCDNTTGTPMMSGPYIVVGIHKPDGDTYGSVTIRNLEGRYWSSSTHFNSFAACICDSYKVGDTIK